MRWGKKEQVKYKTIEELKEASILASDKIGGIMAEANRKHMLKRGKKLRESIIEALLFDPGELETNLFIMHPFVLRLYFTDGLKVTKLCSECGKLLYNESVVTPINLGEALSKEGSGKLECEVCKVRKEHNKLWDRGNACVDTVIPMNCSDGRS